MNQSPMARTITEGEDVALSMLGKLFATRSSNSDSSRDLRGFATSDQKVIYGHSLILSAASPILDSIIKTAARKDKQEKKKNSVIAITDVNSVTLTEVFRFIYTGRVEDLQKHQTSLLTASEKFHLNALRSLCARSISQTLSPSQAHFHLARMAVNHLPDVCLLIVFDHFPIKELFLTLSPVCRRWRGLLKSACCRRRALTLLVGHRAQRLLQRDFRSKLEIPYIDYKDDQEEDANVLNLVTRSSKINNNNNDQRAAHLFLYHKVPDRLATWFRGLTRLRLEMMTVNGHVLSSLANQVLTAEHYRSQLTSLHLNLALSHTVTGTELASLFTQMSSSCSAMTELTLICRRFTSRRSPTEVYQGWPVPNMPLLNVQPPVIGSIRSLTYHCTFPFDIARFKESVHTGMPHLAHLALYTPFFKFNHHQQRGNEMQAAMAMQATDRPSLSDVRGREPYRELLSAPNALPPSIFTNLGVKFQYEDGQPQQPFTGLRSLKLHISRQESTLLLVMTTLARSLAHCLEHLDLCIGLISATNPHQQNYFQQPLFLPDGHPQLRLIPEPPPPPPRPAPPRPLPSISSPSLLQSMLSASFPRLTVLEMKFGYSDILLHSEPAHLEHWVPSPLELATLCPRLRVLRLWFESSVWCPPSAALVCPVMIAAGAAGAAGAAARNHYSLSDRITRAHLACIRLSLDEIWNASGGGQNGNGHNNNNNQLGDSESSINAPTAPSSRPRPPPPPLLPELSRLLVCFSDSYRFEHWPELVRKNDNDNDSDNQNNKKTV